MSEFQREIFHYRLGVLRRRRGSPPTLSHPTCSRGGQADALESIVLLEMAEADGAGILAASEKAVGFNQPAGSLRSNVSGSWSCVFG